jgi:hypothetical protein
MAGRRSTKKEIKTTTGTPDNPKAYDNLMEASIANATKRTYKP